MPRSRRKHDSTWPIGSTPNASIPERLRRTLRGRRWARLALFRNKRAHPTAGSALTASAAVLRPRGAPGAARCGGVRAARLRGGDGGAADYDDTYDDPGENLGVLTSLMQGQEY